MQSTKVSTSLNAFIMIVAVRFFFKSQFMYTIYFIHILFHQFQQDGVLSSFLNSTVSNPLTVTGLFFQFVNYNQNKNSSPLALQDKGQSDVGEGASS